MADNFYIKSLDETDKTDTKSMWDGAVVIRKEDLKLITRSGCKHEAVRDPSDDSEHWIAYKCKYCPLGRLIKK